MIRWPWRYRYQVVIIGTESGNRTSLPFVRFRDYHKAHRWCARMNMDHASIDGLTYYNVEEIPGA